MIIFETNRMAKFRTSYKALEGILNLPEGAKIVLVHGDALMGFNKVFEVFVEAPGLKEVFEGEEIPEIYPVWKTVDESHRRPIFDSWGQG